MDIYNSDAKVVLIALFLVIVVNVYGFFIRPIKCKKLLIEYAKAQHGHLISAIKVSLRGETYIVYIEIDGQSVKSIVEFSLFYNMTWL